MNSAAPQTDLHAAPAPEFQAAPAPGQSGESGQPSQSCRLGRLVLDYLAVLRNERGASAHTLRAYERELLSFAHAMHTQLGIEARPDAIEHTAIRGYLGELYQRGLSRASIARALAAIRSWFR